MSELEFERARAFRPTASSKPEVRPSSSLTTDIAAGPARPVQQIDEAIREFESQDEGVIMMLMKNANILMEAGEHRLALNILRNVLMRQPNHPSGLEAMGLCLREGGRYEEALKCFRALTSTERKLDAQLLIAETLYLGERDDMALAAYREVLKTVVSDQSKLFAIFKNIGNIHVRAGEYELAEEFYDKAYGIDPTSDVLMVNYGTLEIQRESLSEAVQRFRRSVEINPDNDRGWVGLAIVHRKMGDLDLAWANVQRALDINRRNRTALRLVVEWGMADNRWSVTIERLQDYLEAEGEDAEMSFTLAKIFTQMGRLTEARLELERVLALDPAIEGAEALSRVLDREIARARAERAAPEASR